MVLVAKIKKVARKVNTVALAGAMVVGGMTLMSFVGEKEDVKVEVTKTTDVIRGVLNPSGATPGRIYLTDYDITADQGFCTFQEMLCRILVNPALIKTDGSGRKYIDETDAHTEVSNNGPYSETPLQ